MKKETLKKFIAILLVSAFVFSFTACHKKSENAKRVDDMISSIGTVTLESSDQIATIDKEYEALTEEEKMELDRLEDLEGAKLELEKLESQKRIDDTKALITAIGKVTLKSQKAINDAQKAYDSLSDTEKKAVDNYDVIAKSQSEYDKLVKANKKKKAESEKLRLKKAKEILKNYSKDNDEFQDTIWYMSKNMPEYIDSRSYIIPYVGFTSSSMFINIRYNYTGEDWVFYKKITFVVDGKKYYKSFRYFDITHDNDSGYVCEYIDENASADDIEMLRAIAKSKTAKARFEGDDYWYDLVIKDSDKKIMKEVLKAYDVYIG
ncbi:hypothetical protein [Eubacterium sp.]